MVTDAIQKSWDINAKTWIEVLENKAIASRKYSNPAIVETLLKDCYDHILDMGCGEGWLTHALSEAGRSVVGLDATAELLEHARKNYKGDFHQLSYEQILAGAKIPNAPFDAVVFNFSIYGKNQVGELLNAVGKVLNKKGVIVIQTLHPFFLVQQGLSYKGQWVSDSWAGLPDGFTHPHKWYARTLGEWLSLFSDCDLQMRTITEPLNDKQQPVSIIFELQCF